MIRKTVIILFGLHIGVSAFLQFEIKNHIIAAEKTAYNDQVWSDRLWNFDSNLYSLFEIWPNLSVYCNHRIDGSTIYMALPERTIPLANHTALGIQYEKKTLFHLGFINDVLGRAEGIRPYYLVDENNVVTLKMLNGANLRWDITGKKVGLLMDVNYFWLNYELDDGNAVSSQMDYDSWAVLDFHVRLIEAFGMNIGTLTKMDMSATSDFNYSDHRAGIGGMSVIKLNGGRKLFLDWYMVEHYRTSDALDDKGDAVGLATEIRMRPVLKMRKKFYLKGNVKLDLSEKMKKQWYEVILRKAFKKNALLDFGYWFTGGSYFPRQGVRSKIEFYMGPIGLIPHAQFFWRVNRDGGTYSYYRTTASLELLVNINRIDIFGGYLYSHYKDLHDIDPLVSRGNVYFGVRKW